MPKKRRETTSNNTYRRFSRTFLAAMLFSSTTLYCPPSRAQFDPATISLGIGIAQTVLSLTDRTPNLTSEMLQLQLTMLEGINERLDAIEGSLSVLLREVSLLKKNIADLLDHDRDIVRKETVIGLVNPVQNSISGVKIAMEKKNPDLLLSQRIRLRENLDHLEAEISSLRLRSDFVLPTLVNSLTVEFSGISALILSANGDEKLILTTELENETSAFDKRFADMLDANRINSLVSIRKGLEDEQLAAGKQISTLVIGKSDAVATTHYPWYSHTLIGSHTERKYSLCLDGGEIKNEMVECWSDVQVTDYINSHTVFRDLTVQPLDDFDGTSLSLITLARPSEVRPPNPGFLLHGNSNDEFEAAKQKEDSTLDNLISTFNRRAHLIASIISLEQIAVEGRILLLKWDDKVAEALAQRALGTADVREQIDESERAKSESDARAATQQMDLTRDATWRKIAEAKSKYSAAVEEARAQSWRADLQMGLQVVDLSMRTLEFGERLGLIGEAIDKTPTEAAASAQAPTLEPSPIPTKEAGKDTNKQTVENKTASVFNLNEEVVATLPDQKKALLVEWSIREIEKTPAEKWKHLPRGLTREETIGVFGLKVLDSMGETYADKLNGAYKKRVEDSIVSANGIKGLKSGTSALLTALLPTPLDGGTLVDAPSRHEMRRELTTLLRAFADRRLQELTKSK